MTNSRETDELIERYCRGELTPEELRIFMQWLESDPELHKAVEEHNLLLSAFNIVAERNRLKNIIASIHDEMETEQFAQKSPLKVVKDEPGGLMRFYRRYRAVSIAAMITIIAVSGTLLTGALTGMFSTKQQSAYQALRLEVERLKRSQSALISGINEAKSTPEPAVTTERGFIGTGAALTKDGYVLTSSHVVKGARNIYIGNSKFEQLKVKVVYKDDNLDVAVLKVDEENFKSFGELPYHLKSTSADPGERVFTLGYPRTEMVYNEGSLSSVTGFEGDTSAYQISIPVNPGNSGGPLFDNHANFIGIISGRNSGAEGASFAVQSKYIVDFLNSHSEEEMAGSRHNLRGIDRPSQIRKLQDFVFMVKVFN